MRAVVQRVARASVRVDGQEVASIGAGLLVLLAVAKEDTEAEAAWLARKVARLRLFPGPEHPIDRSLLDTGGSALVVSQFTLYGDPRKGNRPSFAASARPEVAAPLVDRFGALLAAEGVPVQSGRFGAMMDVELVNEGPVTLIVDAP
ncbi:MAG: D-tyrosyl-tRNA(Tyr) deacylase [Deltaproteobacteria bacterium]|nr:D-tyrosyl-tRNA(Tyr) deacylase [Deltaproteobacteria bacterium]